MCCSMLQCVAVCCNVLQCVAACCSVLQRLALCCSVLKRVAVCCSLLQCVVFVAVCCSVSRRGECERCNICDFEWLREGYYTSHVTLMNESCHTYE